MLSTNEQIVNEVARTAIRAEVHMSAESAGCVSVEPAGHTPGPWELGAANRHEIFAPSGFIGRVYETDAGPGSSAANARLIAAAPELLGALKLAFEYAPFHADACNGVVEYEEGVIFDTTRDCDCFIAKMRAAIAKAEGRDS